MSLKNAIAKAKKMIKEREMKMSETSNTLVITRDIGVELNEGLTIILWNDNQEQTI